MIKCVFIPIQYGPKEWDGFFIEVSEDRDKETCSTWYIEAELPALPKYSEQISFDSIDVLPQLLPQLPKCERLRYFLQWWMNEYHPEISLPVLPEEYERALRMFCNRDEEGFYNDLWIVVNTFYIADDEHVYIYIKNY